MLALRFLLGNNPVAVTGDPRTMHTDAQYVSRLTEGLAVRQRQALLEQEQAQPGSPAVRETHRQLSEIGAVDEADGLLLEFRTLDRTLLADTTILRWMMAQADPAQAERLGIPSMQAAAPQRRAVRELAASVLRGELEEAGRVAAAFRSLSIRDPVVGLITGLVHLWRNEPEAMLASLRMAVDTAPQNARSVHVRVMTEETLARALFVVGEHERAMEEQVAALESRREAGLPDGFARYRLAVYGAAADRTGAATGEMASLIHEQPRFLLVALTDEDLAPLRGGLRRGFDEFVDKAHRDVARGLTRLRMRFDLMLDTQTGEPNRDLLLFSDSLEEMEATVGSGAVESHIDVLRAIDQHEAQLRTLGEMEDVRIQTEEVEHALQRARAELDVTLEALDRPSSPGWVRTLGRTLLVTWVVTAGRVVLYLVLWRALPIDYTTQGAVLLTAIIPLVWTLLGMERFRQQQDLLHAISSDDYESRKATVATLEARASHLRQEMGALTQEVCLAEG